MRSYVRDCDAERLRHELGPRASEVAEMVPDVRRALPETGASRALEDPDQARFRLFDAVTSFLREASRTEPLVLDDLRRADDVPSQAPVLARGRGSGRLDLGEIELVDDAIENHSRLSDELRQPFYIHVSTAMRAMRALLVGDFSKADTLVREARCLGQELASSNVEGVFGLQMFALRRDQGRLGEVARHLELFGETHGFAPTWKPGLAILYSELGRKEQARSVFEELAMHDFDDVPLDSMWLASLALLAEARSRTKRRGLIEPKSYFSSLDQ